MSSKKRSFREKLSAELKRFEQKYIDPSRRSLRLTLRRRAMMIHAFLTYRFRSMSAWPDRFLLVRIIGNDLEPRHETGQSRRNVEFILKNEAHFPDCKKVWVVNRIMDNNERRRIIELLERYGQEYKEIPFDLSEYGKVQYDFGRLPEDGILSSSKLLTLEQRTIAKLEISARRNKVNYLMNNNGARNFALKNFGADFKWIMPWDGNCFLTPDAFRRIRGRIMRRPYLPYVIVPMARIEDNSVLLQPEYSVKAKEEPQVIFRADAKEEFNSEIPYGRRPKVDLLWRLGVPGRWDRFPVDPSDFPKPSLADEAGLYQTAGWVARLDSGRPEFEVGKGSSARRAVGRDEAILRAIEKADSAWVERMLSQRGNALLFYDREALRVAVSNYPLASAIRNHADDAVQRGPYSVMDKTGLGPSGDKHDYFSPAPYWWPTDTDDKSFVHKDGDRVPGSALFEPGSEQYDRSNLQRLFDDTTALALGWSVTGEAKYAEKAAELLRCWFLRPETRMNPHLTFAQTVNGKSRNKTFGIIEFKDIYYFLDAVALVIESGSLSKCESDELKAWFSAYSDWLESHSGAQAIFRAHNNHGVYFDLQRFAIGYFLRDPSALATAGLYARSRIYQQFATDGSLPAEMRRAAPKHYMLFTMQAWTTMARMLSAIGDDLWNFRTNDDRCLSSALKWTVRLWNEEGGDEKLDHKRLHPVLADLAEKYGYSPPGLPENEEPELLFKPTDGIAPFWILRRS
ncbi:MAG: alginate lyase family protein [Mesorhizobium sp.]|nr:alginate lyase family protein [Mesorhizobium sp.]MBL8579967.1 alginate lyase family protein [Mesorhizobium sp.]